MGVQGLLRGPGPHGSRPLPHPLTGPVLFQELLCGSRKYNHIKCYAGFKHENFKEHLTLINMHKCCKIIQFIIISVLNHNFTRSIDTQ